MPSQPPLISVIVACKNPGAALRATVESVWAQHDPPETELVVIDGGSTDGSVAWLEEQRSRIGQLVSEPDSGAYAAMNKGARLARGEWLLFLGANDRLADPEVLAALRDALSRGNADLFCGEAVYADGRVWHAPVAPIVGYRNFMHHQSSFYRRTLFDRLSYDETLRIQADYDLNLRLWLAGVRPVPLPVRVAVCATGGLSDGGAWANYREEIAVRHRHFPAWRCWPWDLGSVLRYLRKKIVRSSSSARPE
jgi:putative colanic acid biosynthesis glycosyltransferase